MNQDYIRIRIQFGTELTAILFVCLFFFCSLNWLKKMKFLMMMVMMMIAVIIIIAVVSVWIRSNKLWLYKHKRKD
jgi:hypothetical protein